ncbi:MAG TPA: hypothetical protein VMR00_20095 [Streptosporangiaceae bacterium]|nr:hypothetical protein [Streptosporangiaceae bacterium]
MQGDRSRAALAAQIMTVLTAGGRPSVGLNVWRSIVASRPSASWPVSSDRRRPYRRARRPGSRWLY